MNLGDVGELYLINSTAAENWSPMPPSRVGLIPHWPEPNLCQTSVEFLRDFLVNCLLSSSLIPTWLVNGRSNNDFHVVRKSLLVPRRLRTVHKSATLVGYSQDTYFLPKLKGRTRIWWFEIKVVTAHSVISLYNVQIDVLCLVRPGSNDKPSTLR